MVNVYKCVNNPRPGDSVSRTAASKYMYMYLWVKTFYFSKLWCCCAWLLCAILYRDVRLLYFFMYITSIYDFFSKPWSTLEYFKPHSCFICLQCFCVSLGCLGVWGELVNNKRSLTHRPSSQGLGTQASHSFCNCMFVYIHVPGSGFPFFTFFATISYGVCYTHVYIYVHVHGLNHNSLGCEQPYVYHTGQDESHPVYLVCCNVSKSGPQLSQYLM